DDGYGDLLIGAYYDDTGGDRAGATYLVLGPVSGTASLATAAKLYGEEPSDFAGRSGSGAGDVNGDGYDDLLIGALYEDTGGDAAGAAYLVLGPATGVGDLAGAEAKLIGESVGDIAGRSVAGAGDVNGDGYDDLLIGAQWSDVGGEDSGAAYLVLGGPGL
ncbi:integrin alpha, partial [Myxococcota bacterium]|nr:integrin alpha [Myxococcota bacterium]